MVAPREGRATLRGGWDHTPGDGFGFTTDREAANEALTDLTAGGWTEMYDALHVVLDLFEERAPDGRAIVLLTDGGDNRSQATLQDTIERLEAGDQILHIIELITADRPEERLATARRSTCRSWVSDRPPTHRPRACWTHHGSSTRSRRC